MRLRVLWNPVLEPLLQTPDKDDEAFLSLGQAGQDSDGGKLERLPPQGYTDA